MATRLTMLSFISVAFAFYFLAAFPFAAQGYTITYYQQDNGTTSPVTTYAPSVFWGGACTTTVFGYSTGRDSDGSYSVLSQYFSPDMTEKATSSYSYTANQTCKLQTTTTGLNFSTPLNGFYENAMKTTFTASMSQESYMKVVYDCEPDSSEWFRYYNTWNNDSYSSMPFGYLETFTTCFKQSPADCGNTLANELGNISNYINARYKPCGAGMRAAKDIRYTSPGCGSIVSDATANFYTLVPFNSGAAGRVNVSIYNAYAYGSSGYTPTYQFYIYDVATNTTIVNLGTSLGSSTQTLEKNKDYWLLLGVRVAVDNLNCGSGNILVGLQWINYSLAAWAYEPDFDCSDWSFCDTEINQRSRICTDLNGKVPIEIQTEACTATTDTIFNKTLGFEYGYDQDVYVCSRKNLGFYLPCENMLLTYPILMPSNWSNSAGKDYVTGVYRENTARLTSIYGSKVGINALMLRYIPPKEFEPIATDTYPTPPTTECGNRSTGSEGIINTPYNNGTYINTNVTLSSMPEISTYVKKCPLNEVQFDTLAEAFILGFNASCGKLFYDGSDGSKTINGNYQILVQGWQNRTEVQSEIYDSENPTYNFLLNTTYYNDGNISYTNIWDDYYDTIGLHVSTAQKFKNGTIVSIYLSSIVGETTFTIEGGPTVYFINYALVDTGGVDGFYNFTLNNIPNETSDIYFHSGGSNFLIDWIAVYNEYNVTQEYINFPFSGEATDDWTKVTVPLSHLGLQDNGLYTIYLGVTSKTSSSIYPDPSCVLFDDFQVQNAVTVLDKESCTSGCDSQNRYIKGVWVGYCLRYELPAYSDECLSPTEQDIKSKIETCNYTQDWYCTEDGVYHIFDCTLKVWEDRVNTTLCSTTVIDQAESNQTESILGDLFDIGAFSFLLSPFMIIMYIGLILAGIITFYTEAWELGALAIVMVLVGGTFGGLVPAWVLFTIVIFVVALIAYRFAAAGG